MMARKPRSLADTTLREATAALTQAGKNALVAANNALELLRAAGLSGSPGDTADELRTTTLIFAHILREFNVRIKTETKTTEFKTRATTSYGAYEYASEKYGSDPCGISVAPSKRRRIAKEPDQAALVAAHRKLAIAAPLEEAMKDTALRLLIRSAARSSRPRYQPVDYRMLAANDID